MLSLLFPTTEILERYNIFLILLLIAKSIIFFVDTTLLRKYSLNV